MSKRIKGLIEIFFGRKADESEKGSADEKEPDPQIEFDFDHEGSNNEAKKGNEQ